jgi:subtilisin-like proprotein convertase family protein
LFYNNTMKTHIRLVSTLLLGFLYGYSSAQACDQPFLLPVLNTGLDSIEVRWFDNGNADSFEIRYAPIYDDLPSDPQITGITSASYFITGLSSATQYQFQVRSRCMEMTINWSNKGLASTHISEVQNCDVYLPLRDNNCSFSPDVFLYEVNSVTGLLGVDLFIDKVSLTIDHPWPADLKLELESPSGNRIQLIEHVQIAGQHLGDPQDTTCAQHLIFSDDACLELTGQLPPFIGTFKAEEAIVNLYDSTVAKGIWRLLVCDRASGDIGLITHFNIEFSNSSCLPPNQLYISEISNDAVQFYLPDHLTCDSIVIELGPAGFHPKYPADPDIGETQQVIAYKAGLLNIESLMGDTDYDFYFYAICGERLSIASCPYSVTTLCGDVAFVNNFDSLQICPPDCGFACPIGNGWQNIYEDDFDWIIAEGPSSTSGTGPESAYPFGGKYLLAESSSPDCQQGKASILQSECLSILDAVGNCDLIYHTYMSGIDVGSLKLQASSDGGNQWLTLDSLAGDQGALWLRRRVGLESFTQSHFMLRFVAQMGDGPLGDIAIDAISFSTQIQAEIVSVYYADQDEDGFGVDSNIVLICSNLAPPLYTNIPGDCDDDNENIHPDADEIPCNLIDENCNGMSDDSIGSDYLLQTFILNQASCTGSSDGNATIQIVGGTPPFSFEWNNGSQDSILSNVGEGAYSCIVMDQSGCRQQSPIVLINSIQQLNYIILDIHDPACSNSGDGSISLGVSGDTSQIDIFWNNGDKGFMIDSLDTGIYEALIKDSSGCELITEQIHLESQSGPQLNFVLSNPPSCHDVSDGSLVPQIVGGSLPYSYIWSTGDTTRSINGLEAGPYSLTVTDAVGCMISEDSIIVDNVDSIYFIINTLDNPTCYNTLDGQIQIDIRGGMPPYSTFWTDGMNTIISNDLLDVGAGIYTASVQDFNNCIYTKDSIILSAPDTLGIHVDSVINVSCGIREDGSIFTTAIPIDQNLNLSWNSGQINETDIIGLSMGFYRCTISNDLGCKNQSDVIEVSNDHIPLTSGLQIMDSVSCFDQADASILASITEGVSPFSVKWENQVIQVDSTNEFSRNNLSSGDYWFFGMDSFLCESDTAFITIIEPEPLLISVDSFLYPGCIGEKNGEIWTSVIGGTQPYHYLWNNGLQSDDIGSLAAGNYSMLVTDYHGCSIESEVVFLPEQDSFYYSKRIIELGGSPELYELRIFPTGGLPPYSIDWKADSLIDNEFTADSLGAAWYHFYLSDDVGCNIFDSVAVGFSGLYSKTDGLQLSIFPNPARDYIQVSTNKPIDLIRLLDQYGRESFSFINDSRNRSTEDITLDLRHLPPGLYVVRIHSAPGIYSGRIILH